MKKNAWIALVLAAVMTLSLGACGKKEDGIALSGESVDVNDIALRPDGEASNVITNGDYKLLVPMEYRDLLVTETPENAEDGTLFSVSEKASIEADKAQGGTGEGAGWLFAIARISEAKRDELLSNDIPGAEIFAGDTDGNYFVYYHPTDVRIVRENYEGLGDENNEDWQQWTALNDWAWNKVRESFLAENAGLAAYEPEPAVNGETQEAGETPETAENTDSGLGYAPEEFVGLWAEKSVGRGTITIAAGEGDSFDVVIDWPSSAAQRYIWEMTATPGGEGSELVYENARHYIRTFESDEKFTDEVQYENGTGKFVLNSAYEVMWQDDVDGAGDDTVFVSAN